MTSIRYGGKITWADPLLILLPAMLAMSPQLVLSNFWLTIFLLAVSCIWTLLLLFVFSLGGFNSKAWVEGSRIQLPMILIGFFLGQVIWFSSLFLFIQSINPSAFNQLLGNIDAFYFSLSILTTTGFGDINASSNGAKIAVSIEMLCSVVTMIVILSTAASKAFEKK